MKTKRFPYLWLIILILIGISISNFTMQVTSDKPVVTPQISKSSEVETGVLSGYKNLHNVVKIYIPSTILVDKAANNARHVDQALEKFSKLFGGATAMEGIGAWVADDKKLVKEKVTIVYSYGEKLDKKALDEVVGYARQVKQEMKQSSVALEVNGKMYFIE
ncbi:DUF3574 domain-containing protein [Baia soyae]|uniref:DUF3574 domain-containing protein n=1 Tax=Baia soyae TaxID=1544746 RepID=A0A4R2SAS2_9BACL|nr:DUF3574 domain-containing protein [Baia soyae]TCP68315.1 hypothetical protein EDD57_11854 [Baia soyae]